MYLAWYVFRADIWDQLIYQGACPWRKTILHLSSRRLLEAHYLGMRPDEISLTHTGHYAGLLGAIIVLKIYGYSFLIMPGRQQGKLVLRLLQDPVPLFPEASV